MKIAALYARVSTDRQEKEATIDSQIAEVEGRIKQDGNILGENLRFIDDGWSGDLLARPALDAMRDAAARKEFEVLYIWDRDRLSRRFIHQGLIIEELEALGIGVVDLHSSEAKTPEDKILLGFKGLFAEYEKAKIAERMRRGKLYKAKNGNVVHGPAPYGYTYVPKTKDRQGYYVVNEEEAAVVRKMFRWIADEGLTIRQVIKRLFELKVYPRKRRREAWTNGPLCRLLRNESYIGTTYYNKSQAVEPQNPVNHERYKKIKKSSRRLKPKEEWIAIPIPPIIDESLFWRAQEQLKINAQFSMRNKKHDYLLSGLIYCQCGSRMGCEGSGGQYYYRCQNRLKRYPLPRDCFAGGVNIGRVDGVVWETIKKLLESPQLIKNQAERWLNRRDAYIEDTNGVERLKEQLAKIGEEEKRQAEAYGSGLISFELFKKLVGDIKQRKVSLESQIVALTNEHNKEILKPALSIEKICQIAPLIIEDLLEEEKRTVLLKLVREIIVNQERSHATIRGYIPLYLEKEENLNYGLRSIGRDSRLA